MIAAINSVVNGWSWETSQSVNANVSIMGAINSVFNSWSWETFKAWCPRQGFKSTLGSTKWLLLLLSILQFYTIAPWESIHEHTTLPHKWAQGKTFVDRGYMVIFLVHQPLSMKVGEVMAVKEVDKHIILLINQSQLFDQVLFLFKIRIKPPFDI